MLVCDTNLDGWEVQRRCPHLKADLSRFGHIEDGVLTCQMHGWKWDLSDGSCLTSEGHPLRCAPVGSEVDVDAPEPVVHDDHHGQHDDEVDAP